MKPSPTFPSIDLYPIHDNDGFLRFVMCMWHNTAEIWGPPTIAEVRDTLAHFSEKRQGEVIDWLTRHRQISSGFACIDQREAA